VKPDGRIIHRMITCAIPTATLHHRPKKPRRRSDEALVVNKKAQLQEFHVRGLRSFRTFGDVELNAPAFLERLEPLADNSRVVDENVGPVFTLDEAETFAVVEPLHSTFCHARSTSLPRKFDPASAGVLCRPRTGNKKDHRAMFFPVVHCWYR